MVGRCRMVVAVAVVIAAVFAVSAEAGVVTVKTVSASQYTYPWFGATVYAYGTVNLANAHLVVQHADGTESVVAPDEVSRYVLDGQGNYVQWNIVKYATGVVKPGDELVAVVTDAEAGSGELGVPCVAGSTKKKSKEAAVCR